MPFIAFIGRLLLAAVFIWSGYGKLTGAEGTMGYISSVNMPIPANIAYWIAVVVELGGGILLVIGLLTRYAAAALAVFTIAAAYFFHNDFANQMQMIQLMKNVAIAGGLLQVVAFGAGPFSIDRS